MRIFKDVPNIKFMKIRNIGFLVSAIIIAFGIALFFIKGFNMGIEFTGGTNLDVSFRENISISNVRNALNNVGLGSSVIQQVSGENRFIIKAALEKKGKQGQSEVSEKSGDITAAVENALMTEEEKNFKTAKKLDINSAPEKEIAGLLVSKGVPRDTADAAAAKLAKSRKDNKTGLINNEREIDALNLANQARTVLKENTYLGRFTFLSVESIGPQVGKDMRTRVMWATILSLIGMLIYIWLRFRILYGISAVLTLVHDTLMVLTFLLVFQIEFSLQVQAAILTLIGYSINDTIVVFDRLRDNLTIMKRDKLEIILDASINQTLSRTVITAGTVFLTVIAMFFFGGEVLHAFSATLLFGVVVGTYSSIFQSCAYLMVFEKKFIESLKKK